MNFGILSEILYMPIKKLLRLFGVSKNTASSEAINSDTSQTTIKRIHHRGYLLENSTSDTERWKAKINGKVITGDKTFIETSIDWWCDKKTELSQEKFSEIKNTEEREIVVHKGFKILNDTGDENSWYMLHNGRLLKGSKLAIIKKIDIYIKRSKNKNIHPKS